MIKVGQYSFDLKIESYSLPFGALSELIVVEEAGGTIPHFQMSLRVTDPVEIYKVIINTNAKVKVGFGTDEAKIEYLEFVLSDFSMDRSGSMYSFTLFGILDLKDFTNKSFTKSYKNKNSSEVLNMLTTIKPDVTFSGSDSQTWIQHNTSDREFVKQIISHAYVSDSTYVCYAVSSDKSLIVRDGKMIFSNDPKLKFSNVTDSPDEIVYNSYTFATNSSLLQFLFAEGAKLPMLKINEPKTELIDVDEKSPINGELYNLVLENKNFPTVLNCLNTHDNFHKAKLLNFKRNANQESKTMVLNITDTLFPSKEVKLLDTIRFTEKSTEVNSLVTGIYTLIKKSFHLTGEAVSTELVLARDFFSK